MKGKSRSGIAPLVLAVILVVVIAVAGVGVYVFVFTSTTTGSGGSTPTVTIGSSPSVTNSHTSTVTIGPTTPTGPTTGTQGYDNYRGVFTYVTPLGPFGINDSSGKPVEWNSTQTASGSFTFSIDPANYTGTGSGQGSITVTTQGYCTGTVTLPYTFTVQAVHAPGENFIISFNTPTPSDATVQLTCQGSTNGFNTANNPVTFLSVYPNGLSLASIPATSSQVPTAGTSYTVTITQAS
ncbi:MAG TPA: hypothetical protein VLY82_07825 [Nitrososphaerales archaeon]|nr:hypothetical protein [Nitrososphaerales archaeon]